MSSLRTWASLILLLTTLATPSGASAQGADELDRPTPGIPFADVPLGDVYVGVGQSVGGPEGVVSLAAGWVPNRWITLGLALGLGLAGPQVAVSAAAFLPYGWGKAVGIEVGTSAGPYGNLPCELDVGTSCTRYEWARAHWAHAAVVGRWRLGRAWWHRFRVGYTRMLNPGDGRCRSDSAGTPCTADPREQRDAPFLLGHPFLAVEFAYTFDP